MNRLMCLALILSLCALAFLGTGCKEEKTTFGTVSTSTEKDKK